MESTVYIYCIYYQVQNVKYFDAVIPVEIQVIKKSRQFTLNYADQTKLNHY